MQSGNYEYQSDFARKYVAQGIEQGLEQGLHKGEMEALFEVLDARGLRVDARSRRRIQGCTELAQLKHWLRLAVTVQSVQQLFEPPPAPKPPARKASRARRSSRR